MSAVESTATPTATVSSGRKARSIGAPSRRPVNTRTGATKSAICFEDSQAMPSAISMSPRRPKSTAVECSAAFPTTATITTPTNVSGKCTAWSVPSSAPTSSSLATAVAPAESVSATTALQSGRCSRSGGGRRAAAASACVRSWKSSESAYMAIRTTEISSESRCARCGTCPAVASMVGTASATTARNRVETWAPAEVRLNRSVGKRTPPATMAAPPTRRRFATMLPVRLPLTRSTCPRASAEMPRISSAALPKVTLRRLPRVSPTRSASSSVASPMLFASGISESAESTNTAVGLPGQRKCTAMASGRSSSDPRQSQRVMPRRHLRAGGARPAASRGRTPPRRARPWRGPPRTPRPRERRSRGPSGGRRTAPRSGSPPRSAPRRRRSPREGRAWTHRRSRATRPRDGAAGAGAAPRPRAHPTPPRGGTRCGRTAPRDARGVAPPAPPGCPSPPREREVVLRRPGVREHARDQLRGRLRSVREQVQDARLALLVEGEEPVDHLGVAGERLAVPGRDQPGGQLAGAPRRADVLDQRAVAGLRPAFEIEQVVVREQHPLILCPEAHQAGRVARQVQHLGGVAREAQARALADGLDLLDGTGHAAHVLPVHAHVAEQLVRRAQPIEVRRVQVEPLRGPVAPGQLVVVAQVRVYRRARLLLRGARIAVVIDVPVGDEDAPHLAQAASQRAKTGQQRIASLAGADARIEEGQPSAVLLDEVDVRRPPGLGERHRDRDAMDAEGGEAAHCSFFTASAISGSALNRSATRP